LVLGGATQAFAQPAAATSKQAPKAGDKDKLIEELELETKDNVLLSVNYYKSKLGKEAAVIVILHHDKGNKQDYDAVAKQLQALGHAVVVPDLRGYGKSTKQVIKKMVAGETKVVDTKTITTTRKQDFEAIVLVDLERIKTFLFERHNAGEFNVRKLGVLGVEMGALIGMNWSLLVDWEWPTLTTGPQGKDVRGLILISPRWNHKGLVLTQALERKEYIAEIPTLIMVGGKDASSLNDSKRLNDQFARWHPEPPPEEIQEKKNLFYFVFDTSLQGFKLLSERKLIVDAKKANAPSYNPVDVINAFITNRLQKSKEVWKER